MCLHQFSTIKRLLGGIHVYLVYILLQIIEKLNGERSLNAAYHLLKGKRSGQSLQDVKLFDIESFFGITPKLTESIYEGTMKKIAENDWITIAQNGLVQLTTQGRKYMDEGPSFHFNGWDYRGKEHLFFKRLSLFVQTISHLQQRERSFLPIQKETDIQQFVKAYFLRHRSDGIEQMRNRLYEEFHHVFRQPTMREEHKQMVVYRLTGHNDIGWTWEQLATEMKLDIVTVRLLFVEALHMMLDTVLTSNEYAILKSLAQHIRVTSYLTDSALKTMYLFQQGDSLNTIAQKRDLQMSTIEDHLIEIAMHSPTFPYDKFVEASAIQSVLNKVEELQTVRLKVLKNAFPELTYFQLRLIVTMKEGSF